MIYYQDIYIGITLVEFDKCMRYHTAYTARAARHDIEDSCALLQRFR